METLNNAPTTHDPGCMECGEPLRGASGTLCDACAPAIAYCEDCGMQLAEYAGPGMQRGRLCLACDDDDDDDDPLAEREELEREERSAMTRPLRPLSAYASLPVPGSGGNLFRLADATPGPCHTCGEFLVGFTFGGASGWLCAACDEQHYGELEKLGARHCKGCDHTEHEHWEPRFAPRCAVLSCPCGAFDALR